MLGYEWKIFLFWFWLQICQFQKRETYDRLDNSKSLNWEICNMTIFIENDQKYKMNKRATKGTDKRVWSYWSLFRKNDNFYGNTCIYTHTHTQIYKCVYVCMYVCMYIYMHVYMYIYMYVYMWRESIGETGQNLVLNHSFWYIIICYMYKFLHFTLTLVIES
jgi:hypothetical protein